MDHRTDASGYNVRSFVAVRTAMDAQARKMAAKYVWWKDSDDALGNEVHFLAQMMTLGTVQDVQWMCANFSDAKLIEVLNQAPPGVFNGRSWHYWHHRLGLDQVPEMPSRRLVV